MAVHGYTVKLLTWWCSGWTWRSGVLTDWVRFDKAGHATCGIVSVQEMSNSLKVSGGAFLSHQLRYLPQNICQRVCLPPLQLADPSTRSCHIILRIILLFSRLDKLSLLAALNMMRLYKPQDS